MCVAAMLNAMALDHATCAVITNGLEADPLAAPVLIDAGPERHVGGVIFADDTLRRIVQKLGRHPPQLREELGIVLKICVVGNGVSLQKPILRLDHRASSVRGGTRVTRVEGGCHCDSSERRVSQHSRCQSFKRKQRATIKSLTDHPCNCRSPKNAGRPQCRSDPTESEPHRRPSRSVLHRCACCQTPWSRPAGECLS